MQLLIIAFIASALEIFVYKEEKSKVVSSTSQTLSTLIDSNLFTNSSVLFITGKIKLWSENLVFKLLNNGVQFKSQ